MVSRKLVIMTPVLLILGIIAQLILLIVAILFLLPCLIWPEILDGPYRWITRNMARIMARAMVGKSKRRVAVVVTDK
jgi:hypothetical protein